MLKGLKQLPSGMDQCNDCESGKCKIPQAWRQPGKIEVQDYEINMMLSGTCPRRLKPLPFKQPLLEMAMDKNPQGVYDTLQRLGMRIVERGTKWDIVSAAGKGGARRYGSANVNRKAVRHKRSNRRAKTQHRN